VTPTFLGCVLPGVFGTCCLSQATRQAATLIDKRTRARDAYTKVVLRRELWRDWIRKSPQMVLKTLVVVLNSEPPRKGPKPNGPLTVWAAH